MLSVPPMIMQASTIDTGIIVSPSTPLDWPVPYDIPVIQPPTQSTVQQLITAIRSTSSLSQRGLGFMLGVTHPTVGALERGQSAGTQDLFERLQEVRSVTDRISLVAGGNTADIDRALSAAKDLLAAREPGQAYAAALAALRPPPADGDMMQSIWPTTPGEATVDLAEVDS